MLPIGRPTLRHLSLCAWIWRSECWRVRLVGGALLSSTTLRSTLLRRRLSVHGLLLIALRRRWILACLLLSLLWVRIATAVLREWLAVCTVELRIWWWVLAAPDGVRRNERLGLGRDGSEDAFLGEALAVGAASILGLVEA